MRRFPTSLIRPFVCAVLLISVVTGTPPAKAQEELRLTGELISPVRSDLVARQAGRIAAVSVDEGDVVRRGQELLRLEATYFELDVRRAQAEARRAASALANAEREMQRKEQLIAKGSVSQAIRDRSASSFEQATAAHESALAALALAEQRLADTVLYAPISGTVAERRVDVGEFLGPQSVAFVIVRTNPLELRFQIPERYLPKVRQGQKIKADFDPYPGEKFHAEISRIDRVVDPAGRNFTAFAVLDNTDGRLSPGLFARVEILLGD